jgi:hypothetical protein
VSWGAAATAAEVRTQLGPFSPEDLLQLVATTRLQLEVLRARTVVRQELAARLWATLGKRAPMGAPARQTLRSAMEAARQISGLRLEVLS